MDRLLSKFKLQADEKLIVNDPHVVWMRGGLDNVKGQLKLTDKRLVFIRDAHPFAIFTLYLVKSMRSGLELEFRMDRKVKASTILYGREKRLTIDPGNERPKQFQTMKAPTFEAEINKLNLN